MFTHTLSINSADYQLLRNKEKWFYFACCKLVFILEYEKLRHDFQIIIIDWLSMEVQITVQRDLFYYEREWINYSN